MPLRILLLNGPNTNLLGIREPQLYGSQTLEQICTAAQKRATELGASLEHYQSNHEGQLCDTIQAAYGQFDAIIINPAGLTHTSVVLRDALTGIAIPFVELHITNVFAREEKFRAHSYFSDKAVAVISGMGSFGYEAAVEFMVRTYQKKDDKKVNGGGAAA